ncbi:MAG TPA: diaminopimelate epimerase [Thiolinea sp.]|nr:diaminopimelate epimerase [Thiolinea sp.]
MRFSKMQGLGNDFMVIDGVSQQLVLTPDQIRFLADRHLGVGFDQLLLVEPWNGAEADFHYRIFNADGGEVEHCGNGARCFARFLHDQGLCRKTEIPVMTAAGLIVLRVREDGQVTVNMGVPELRPARIPFISEQPGPLYTVMAGDRQVELVAVSMGNPHAVIRVENVDTAPVQTLGAELETHPAFPRRVNVGFMQVLAPEHVRLRVFERGVGETLACGTGACAAVVAGRLQGLLGETVQVALPGGLLEIVWRGQQEPVCMTGPATTVFSGEIQL